MNYNLMMTNLLKFDNYISINQLHIMSCSSNLIPKVNISYAMIINIRDSLEQGSIERLLLSMYTYIYPLKYNYYSVKILTFPNTTTISDDYISLSKHNAILHIKQFNTSMINGEITYKLPQPLIDEINNSLNKNPRKYLFMNAKNKPFTESSFISWVDNTLTTLFKINMTIYTIRYAIRKTIDLNKSMIQTFKVFNGFGQYFSVQKNNVYFDDCTFLDKYSKHSLLLLTLYDDPDTVLV